MPAQRAEDCASRLPCTATGGTLELPEHEFTYLAGSVDRPWNHFTGRWEAMKPHLADMLQACGSDRPLRVVDLGACTGFFSLQAAHWHPEADVVAVEGSVGVGNGSAGMMGTAMQILGTAACQTQLRWIGRLGLPNCFVAPEVWDYARVCELASQKRPICDILFLLSIVHHIDSLSVQQYASVGLSRLEGFMDLLAKLLMLAPRHFVELPNKPWLTVAYEAHGTQQAILMAAARATGREWILRGPIYTVDWFGPRELLILEVKEPMPSVDLHSCSFPLLYREYPQVKESTGTGVDWGGARVNVCVSTREALLQQRGASPPADFEVGDAFANAADCAEAPLWDPGLLALAYEPCGPVSDEIGEVLNAAPSQLLVAHLTLREAIMEAEDVLNDMRRTGVLNGRVAGAGAEASGRASRGSAVRRAAVPSDVARRTHAVPQLPAAEAQEAAQHA